RRRQPDRREDSRRARHYHVGSLGSELLAAPFAPDGQPNKRITWWENGVLCNLTYDRYWAQQKNVEPTGFPAGIKMQGGEGTIDDLVRSTERGILVTRFWYI